MKICVLQKPYKNLCKIALVKKPNLKPYKMTKKEFKELEILLGKLESFLGNRYAIIPHHIDDGCHIALYNEKGEMIKQLQGSTIESVSFQLRLNN